MKILNCTQHSATPDQIAAGVVEPDQIPNNSMKNTIKSLITFNDIPTGEEMAQRAADLADLVSQSPCRSVMIGGAPYFMSYLEFSLRAAGITPLYSFTKRETVETPNEDGTVTKTAVFKHIGWVEA